MARSVVDRPAHLELDFFTRFPSLMLDRKLGAVGDVDALSGHLDFEASSKSVSLKMSLLLLAQRVLMHEQRSWGTTSTMAEIFLLARS